MSPSTAEESRQNVVKLVQVLLTAEQDRSTINPALIAQKIDQVVSLNAAWGDGLDREAITDELIRRFSLWIGNDTTLRSDVGHIDWLDAGRMRDWKYWRRYGEWLEKRLSFRAIEALDRSTQTVLGLLEDPARQGPWDRRGLVVGHVQSGKTGHYTGLICKAADAGYKIIIVLAGLHNNLRSQTQMRLDEGFLGYESNPVQDKISIIGVGEIDGDPAIRPNFATNRSDSGDFNTAAAKHLGITPESRPWLFVVKKNKTVLDRLLSWIRSHVANVHHSDTDRKVVTHLPLLLIDDEADHASVDTGEQVFDADGKPDDDHQPTAINTRVRRILHCFERKAYVGYTATPFANIFIHERGETREEGPDLFPASFIHSLSAPSSYVGPAALFGLQTPDGRRGGLPVIRNVEDHETSDGHGGWMPHKHPNGHLPVHSATSPLPPSLIEAIDAFILACAARRVRGQQSDHCSMLVHVTRFNSVQNVVHAQITDHVSRMNQRIRRGIDHEEILQRLQRLWEIDFLPTSAVVRDSALRDQVPPRDASWADIMKVLPDAITDIEVRTINGTAKDALDYVDRTTGLKVIAIGGDKLARGLTLEGLCVSYFLRASKMYDTLMQMGRWFGYRQGYLDLTRLYTTTELAEWFAHIADAAEELREELDLMFASGATPREYGLRVQSHSVLMVTSPLKMRAARSLLLSFSGQLLETVSLYRDPVVLKSNLDAARRLVAALSAPEVNPARKRGGTSQQWSGYLWSAVPAAHVVDFLAAYRTHPEAQKVNSARLTEFVQSMNSQGELTRWAVAVIGGGEGASCDLADGIHVDMLKRAGVPSQMDRYSIGRLLSGRDEAIDLDELAWLAALTKTREAWRADPARRADRKEPDLPNGPAIRMIRGFGAENVEPHPERGLLLLYALDPAKADIEFPKGTHPVIAIGVSFPGSNAGVKVEYKVNHVLWEQQYGPAN